MDNHVALETTIPSEDPLRNGEKHTDIELQTVSVQPIDNKDQIIKVETSTSYDNHDKGSSMEINSDLGNNDIIVEYQSPDTKCDECEMPITDQLTLERHNKMYHTESYKCERCNESFDIHNFNDHIEQCFYKCEMCSYKSTQNARFKKHLKSHTNESSESENKKRYNVKCDICEKSQRDGWHLKRHIESSHEKSNSCKVCCKEFIGLDILSLHLKNCFYTCGKCDFKDRRVSRYERHLRRHMNDENKMNDFTHRVTVLYK